MNIYVLGCGGMLGDYLYKHFSKQGHNVLATDRWRSEAWLSATDVRDLGKMTIDARDFMPDVIINLAALTDLEECEIHPMEAIATNAGGSANCTALAAKLGIPYVYISTAGIFDGQQESYDDSSVPNPICIYGKSKYWGELVTKTYAKHIVLRCGWQMGSCDKDKKFVGKIMKQLKSGVTELNVVTDKQGTPTYVKDFTLQIEKLIETQTYGVFNAVCKGSASRYDVAMELLRILGLQDKIKMNVVGSDFWAKEYFAPRPDSEKLLTTKLESMGLHVMRHWHTALAEYVAENPGFFTI